MERSLGMKRVLVTGGAGYIGSVLTRRLLDSGYEVVVLDALIFTDAGVRSLRGHSRLKLVNDDIRNHTSLKASLSGVDGVVHLAAIANDPSAELDPTLTREVNLEIYPALLSAAADAGVSRFINLSSTAVYGINCDRNLTEDDPINPLTEYSVCKAKSESIVKDYNRDSFTTINLRCGTVCGWSPRMRFDLCANTLTAYALVNRKLTVWGGAQQRPQIHIADLADFVVESLTISADKIGGKTFNAAGHNSSVMKIAETIREVMNGDLELNSAPPRVDERSYHVSSEKMARELGFEPQRGIKDAVVEIVEAYQSGQWKDPHDSLYHNVKRMQALEKSVGC